MFHQCPPARLCYECKEQLSSVRILGLLHKPSLMYLRLQIYNRIHAIVYLVFIWPTCKIRKLFYLAESLN